MTSNGSRRRQPVIWKIIDWIFPPYCAGCGKKGFSFCPTCEGTLESPSHACHRCGKPLNHKNHCQTCLDDPIYFMRARAPWLYHGPIRSAIHQLKYSDNLGLASLFSNFLFSVYLSEHWETDLVAAVPLSSKKMNVRGFNQSEWIARPLAKAIGIPFRRRALWKTADTRTQVGLSRKARRENLRDAFLAEPVLVKSKTVLLVDDVMTTGATFNECSKALLTAGAKAVFCLSVATTNKINDEFEEKNKQED